MKIVNLLSSSILMVLLLVSCSKDEDKSEFSNELRFGTSINYSNFTLNGEGSSFDKGIVAFRLESEEEFSGNSVKFVILKGGFSYSTEIFSNNPTPTGHIFMTGFDFSTSGEYSVTAYIEKPGGDKLVASGSFQVY